MPKSEIKPEEVKESPRAYEEAWASRIINTLLTEAKTGQIGIPRGYKIKGINMVDKGDGTHVVGFIIAEV